MTTIVAFLKPTRIKLVFLVEWALFILITAARGDLETKHQVLVAGYPLIFFYLVACVLAILSQHVQQIANSWKLLVLAVGLSILDQVTKTIITVCVPFQTSLPIVNNWLYLANEHNTHGSWITSVFNVLPVSAFILMQWALAIPVLFFSILYHRYYITTNRKSLWIDITLLGLIVGYTSWMWDMSFRGYIVDFINLPSVVTADLKDILITIGVAALFSELLDNPKISWHWAGWHTEREELIRLVTNLFGFSVQELRETWQAMVSKFRRTARRK